MNEFLNSPEWPYRPLAATAILVVSWFLAAVIRWFLRRAGRTDWIARLLSRSGLLTGLTEPSLEELRAKTGNAVYWFVMLMGAALALGTVNEYAAHRLLEFLVVHLPKALLGLSVLWASKWLAGYWSRSTLILTANEGLRYPWRWAGLVYTGTLFAGIALASELTGVATILVRNAFLIVLAGFVILSILVFAPLLRAHLNRPVDEKENQADEIFR